ncbi:MAG: Fe-S cluster protein [Deltaproteobacteria bacterium]|nr:Fe-S cluster protein [Deltaproteobacteria bacterium]
MLLQGYRKEIFRPECNPSFQSLHCYAHLEQDVGEALPYLNAELGGSEYSREPPSVTFRVQGKIITVHSRLIAVNALKDEAEADKILEWLKREINQAWENRRNIEPCYAGLPRPQLLEILKMLPKTNCKKCGQATCMVFAAQAAEGGKGAGDCPELAQDQAVRLEAYLDRFFAGTRW